MCALSCSSPMKFDMPPLATVGSSTLCPRIWHAYIAVAPTQSATAMMAACSRRVLNVNRISRPRLFDCRGPASLRWRGLILEPTVQCAGHHTNVDFNEPKFEFQRLELFLEDRNERRCAADARFGVSVT